MGNLCKYKDMLGKPRDGWRKYRIFDLAIFDMSVVLLFCIVFSIIFKVSFWITLVITIIIGIIVHRLFCVRTGLDKLLFT